MAAHPLHDAPLPAVVLHELRWQFDGVPLDTVDAGNGQLVDACQQVVQAVAGLVKEGDYFVVREGRRPCLTIRVTDRAREVAVEIGHRFLDGVCRRGSGRPSATGDRFVHPGAATLRFTGVKVEVELAKQFAGGRFDAEEAHVLVPDWRVVAFETDAEQRFDDFEEATENLVLGEILLYFLLGEGVPLLQELFGNVGDVPGLDVLELQLATREGAQVGNVPFGEGPGLDRHVAQKGQYLGHRIGHFWHQRHFGEAGVAEHLRLFTAQPENLADQRRIVQLGSPEFGGASGVGTVHHRPQTATVGVLHHRQVRRHVQREFPAVVAILLGCLGRGLAGVVGQAGQFGLVAHQFGKGVGGVEQVFREFGRKLRKFLRNRLEARLLIVAQLRAGEPEIANLVVDDALPGWRKPGVFSAPGDCLVRGEELEVLTEFGIEARDFGEHAVIRLAPFGDVIDGVQMADNSPRARQRFEAVTQRCREAVPGRCGAFRGQPHDQRAAVVEKLADSRLHVARHNGVEARQAGQVKQRVVAQGGGSHQGFRGCRGGCSPAPRYSTRSR